MSAKLVRHIKVIEDTGNIVEIKMWQVNPRADRPHGYKYSLVYIVNGKRAIGYDNGEGKGDYRHYENKEEPYRFKNLRSLVKDFNKDILNYKKGKGHESKKS